MFKTILLLFSTAPFLSQYNSPGFKNSQASCQAAKEVKRQKLLQNLEICDTRFKLFGFFLSVLLLVSILEWQL
jgi:hypothetical protein